MKKSLEELKIKIIGGQIINRVIANENNNDEIVETRGTIVAKTISSGYISDNEIITNNYKTKCDEKRITKENDVIIKITPPFAAALVDKKHEGLLVSSFCMLLTDIPEEIKPEYLVAYLNSERGVAQVTSRMTGSTISTISVVALKQIYIPILPIEKQNEICKAFNAYLKNIELSKKLIELSKEKVETLLGDNE